jgi:hypothetical protein
MSDTDLHMLHRLFTAPQPSPQVIADGRARLQRSYRRPGIRVPRFSLLAAGGIGIAATAAAAVVAVGIAGTTPPGLTGGTHVELTAAMRTLQNAASTVARHPGVQPRPKQWLLVKSVEARPGHTASVSMEWTTFDGLSTAYYQGGKLVVHSSAGTAISDGTPMGAYDELRKLPPTPQALLAALRTASADQTSMGGSPSVREWQGIVQLLWNSPVAAPAKLQAEIFLALTKIRGLRVEHVTDAQGQPAIGLYLPAAGHNDLLLDPRTYQVVGRLDISSGVYSKAERAMAKIKKFTLPKAGTVTWSIARSTSLVHRPGQH